MCERTRRKDRRPQPTVRESPFAAIVRMSYLDGTEDFLADIFEGSEDTNPLSATEPGDQTAQQATEEQPSTPGVPGSSTTTNLDGAGRLRGARGPRPPGPDGSRSRAGHTQRPKGSLCLEQCPRGLLLPGVEASVFTLATWWRCVLQQEHGSLCPAGYLWCLPPSAFAFRKPLRSAPTCVAALCSLSLCVARCVPAASPVPVHNRAVHSAHLLL